jgi:hypothetical protein
VGFGRHIPHFIRDGAMNIRSAMTLVRMALLFFLAGSPFVPLLAGVYPGQVIPIVLGGALALAAPPGGVVARAQQRFMASLGRGIVAGPGILLSAGGMLAAFWLLLKAAPAGDRRDAGFPTPLDQGGLE